MVNHIHTLETIVVNSEVEALLLESRLIRRFQPHFNLIAKDDKSPYYIHLTREPFPRPQINHQPAGSIAGPFLNRYIPAKIIRLFRRIAPFCSATRPVRRPCLYSHLGLCQPCPGSDPGPEETRVYGKNIRRLRRLLQGRFSLVTSDLKRQMLSASRSNHYETAAILRDRLDLISRLLEKPVLPDEYLQNPNLTIDRQLTAVNQLSRLLSEAGLPSLHLHRVEMYDNAHLAGTSAASAMAVAIDGEIMPRLYRHFRIKLTGKFSDTGAMREILTRRLRRSDWPAPDLIVLDGGPAQISAVISLPDFPAGLPVISLAKPRETVYFPALTGYRTLNLPAGHAALRLLQSLRDEAHRFSRRLHHRLQAKKLLSD